MILVRQETSPEDIEGMVVSQAIVTSHGGMTSHAAVVAIAQNIPVIVGAADATSLINNDEVITVDPRRGIVYRGATTAI